MTAMAGIELASYFSSRDIEAGAGADPRLRGLVSRWHAALDGRPWPLRSDFLPESMPGLLGSLCLYDVEGTPPRFRFRVMGTRVADSHGRDMTGRHLDEVEPRGYADMLRRDLSAAVEGGRPTLRRVSFSAARGSRTYDRAALPLSREGGRIDALLTASVFVRDEGGGHRGLIQLPEL
jgi:hypothetical protein